MSSPLNFPNSPSPGATYTGGAGTGWWTWDGSKWESTTPSPYVPIAGGTMTGLLTLSGDPTAALGAVTKQYSDTKLALVGGTMTGLLVLSGNATANLNPVPLQQLNSALGGYLPLAGGTLTGGLTGTTINTSGNISCSAQVAANSLNSNTSIVGQSLTITTSITIQGANSTIAGPINIGGSGITYTGVTSGHVHARQWSGSAVVAWVDGTNVGSFQFISSDVARKENLRPVAVDPLAVVNQIALKAFDWKALPLGDTGDVYQPAAYSCGYTAQDIEALIPEAVTGAEGDKSVDLRPLVAHLIGAVQRLTERLAALEHPQGHHWWR